MIAIILITIGGAILGVGLMASMTLPDEWEVKR